MNGTSSSLAEKEADMLGLNCCSSSRMHLSHKASVELKWWQPIPAFLEISLELESDFQCMLAMAFLAHKKIRGLLYSLRSYSIKGSDFPAISTLT